MPYLNDRVMDSGLAILNNEAERIDLCSQEPANYTEATSTYTLGFKDFGSPGDGFGAPDDGSPSGRKVSSVAIVDGEVTGNGTVTHWAVSDVANTRLLAAGALDDSQVVTDGNAFALPSFDIGILDPS